MDKVLCLIGLIIIAIGMVCIYDARKITKKFFSSSDRNNATKTAKIVGFVVCVIGSAFILN